ncbi:DinB family protein [Bauldia sp.]|uniref:DinB family protein n=1 Tax=Bauldia sp. TaxID=2575872 RepID=UPI003BA899EA
MKSHYAMFARYNQWANRRLYDAAATLPDADYRADRGAFFGSLHGTLNHLLVGDYVWMSRFTGEGPVPTELDAILHERFADLRAAREVEDERIIAYVDGLSEADIAATLSYRTVVRPQDISQPLSPALAHFFNHQTHHRGQAHGLVTGIAGPDATPPLDLIFFQRETGVGLS